MRHPALRPSGMARLSIVAGGLLCLVATASAGAGEVAAEAGAKPVTPAASVETPNSSGTAPSAPASAATTAPVVSSAPVDKSADLALAPYVAVRALQRLQDQIARGNAAAQAAQPKLLAHVAGVFTAADPTAWSDNRNAAAAALYLFSAGKPSVVRAAIEHASLSAENDRLVKGALAYAEGHDDAARALLGRLDPRRAPAGIGGHLALVMATLYAVKDPQKAGQMLDAARLLVPGTLVEEAALRRQIFMLADAAHLDRFAVLSRQYIRRFRGSLYASNFKARLVSFAERIASLGDVAQMAKFDGVLAELPGADARAVYLTMARDALVAGRGEGARYAAAKAASRAAGTSADAMRANLYTAAANAATEDTASGRTALRAIDVGQLSTGDAELRDAALAVSSSIEANPADHSGGTAAGGQQSAVIDRAQAALAASDTLLEAPR